MAKDWAVTTFPSADAQVAVGTRDGHLTGHELLPDASLKHDPSFSVVLHAPMLHPRADVLSDRAGWRCLSSPRAGTGGSSQRSLAASASGADDAHARSPSRLSTVE